MKKQTKYWLLIALLIFLLAGCGAKPYENLSAENDAQTVAIVRADTTYEFYGFVGNKKLTGKQIGIIDGDKNHKVYQVKGYDDADWLLTELNVFMEQGTYSLFRASDVSDIPADFVLDDDPESHFLKNYQ